MHNMVFLAVGKYTSKLIHRCASVGKCCSRIVSLLQMSFDITSIEKKIAEQSNFIESH